MDELKQDLKREARRHSNKLIKKIMQVIPDLPEIVVDSIHQETLYATMDGYRVTAKANRNGGDNATGSIHESGNH